MSLARPALRAALAGSQVRLRGDRAGGHRMARGELSQDFREQPDRRFGQDEAFVGSILGLDKDREPRDCLTSFLKLKFS
jgi:hypothetical protein